MRSIFHQGSIAIVFPITRYVCVDHIIVQAIGTGHSCNLESVELAARGKLGPQSCPFGLESPNCNIHCVMQSGLSESIVRCSLDFLSPLYDSLDFLSSMYDAVWTFCAHCTMQSGLSKPIVWCSLDFLSPLYDAVWTFWAHCMLQSRLFKPNGSIKMNVSLDHSP